MGNVRLEMPGPKVIVLFVVTKSASPSALPPVVERSTVDVPVVGPERVTVTTTAGPASMSERC